MGWGRGEHQHAYRLTFLLYRFQDDVDDNSGPSIDKKGGNIKRAPTGPPAKTRYGMEWSGLST